MILGMLKLVRSQFIGKKTYPMLIPSSVKLTRFPFISLIRSRLPWLYPTKPSISDGSWLSWQAFAEQKKAVKIMHPSLHPCHPQFIPQNPRFHQNSHLELGLLRIFLSPKRPLLMTQKCPFGLWIKVALSVGSFPEKIRNVPKTANGGDFVTWVFPTASCGSTELLGSEPPQLPRRHHNPREVSHFCRPKKKKRITQGKSPVAPCARRFSTACRSQHVETQLESKYPIWQWWAKKMTPIFNHVTSAPRITQMHPTCNTSKKAKAKVSFLPGDNRPSSCSLP